MLPGDILKSLNDTVKPVLSGHSKKKTKIGFQDRLSLNGEHSAIFTTFIKLPFVIMVFFLSILSGHLRQV